MDIIEAIVIVITIICFTFLGICYIFKDYVEKNNKEEKKTKK